MIRRSTRKPAKRRMTNGQVDAWIVLGIGYAAMLAACGGFILAAII
jgi:hypothetical protein